MCVAPEKSLRRYLTPPQPKDCPRFLGLPEYIQLVGGATLTAVLALQRDISDISICWDGGRYWQVCFSAKALNTSRFLQAPCPQVSSLGLLLRSRLYPCNHDAQASNSKSGISPNTGESFAFTTFTTSTCSAETTDHVP